MPLTAAEWLSTALESSQSVLGVDETVEGVSREATTMCATLVGLEIVRMIAACCCNSAIGG